MVNNQEEINRILTIKGNIIDTLKKIDKQMESASPKDLKELKKKKKRFESKLKKVDEEINILKMPGERIDSTEFVSKEEDIGIVEETVKEDRGMGEGRAKPSQREIGLKDVVQQVESTRKAKKYKNTGKSKSQEPTKQDYPHSEEHEKKHKEQKFIIPNINKLFKSKRIKNKEKSKETIGKNELVLTLTAVFVISLSLLMFEISLTRIFSVIFSYHYAFLAISIALFGLGVGGIFLHIISPKINFTGRRFTILSIFSLLFSLSLVILTLLMLSFPYTDNIMIYYGLMFIPFFIVGLIFALIFKLFATYSSVIYSADLVGAGLGCLLVLIFLDNFGGVNTVIGIGAISSVGAVLFAIASKRKKVVGVTMAVLILVSLLFMQNLSYSYLGDVPIGSDPNKDLFRLMNKFDFEIVETRWSAFGRTDLVKVRNEFNPDEMHMFIDGASGTTMYRFNGDIHDQNNTVVQQIPNSFGAFFPFLFPEKDNVLIIGPGGGRDVLIALKGGAKHITAVEVNRDIVELMEDYSWYNGGIYTDFDNVHVVVDEGRSFLKRSKEKYDMILLSIPVTKTSGSVSGYSLSENYLFTIDSFKDYFDHLTEDGRLVVVPHGMEEVYKLTSIMLKMFEEIGKTEQQAMDHLVVAGPGGHHGTLGVMFPAFIVRKTAYNPSEAQERHDLAMLVGYQHVFVPYTSRNMVDLHLYHWESGEMSFDRCMSPLALEMSAPTDDSPFFYKYEKGIPTTLSSLFGYTLLLSFIVLFVPSIYRLSIYKDYVAKIRKKRERSKRRDKYLKGRSKSKKYSKKPEKSLQISLKKFVLFFSILGFGFMVIEISLFQKFILFLGHPTLSLSILLFSLLISGGLGSLFSNYLPEESLLKKVSMISLVIMSIIIIYIIILPIIFNTFLGSDIFNRALISGILLFPLGFLMGIPFPSGMRMIRHSYSKDIPWMWGINGTFSVLGSVSAIVIAMTSGFTGALVSGALGYFVIFLIFR
jgi:spermidine synthase/MFS family permease